MSKRLVKPFELADDLPPKATQCCELLPWVSIQGSERFEETVGSTATTAPAKGVTENCTLPGAFENMVPTKLVAAVLSAESFDTVPAEEFMEPELSTTSAIS